MNYNDLKYEIKKDFLKRWQEAMQDSECKYLKVPVDPRAESIKEHGYLIVLNPRDESLLMDAISYLEEHCGSD